MAIVTLFVPPLVAAATLPGAPLASLADALKKGTPEPAATLNPDMLRQLQNFTHKSQLAANAPWLTHTFAGLFVVFALALIVLLAVQTTKQEGLSGTIGGRVESAYRPRLGFDQQLSRLTSYVAIAMVFFALVLSITGI